MADIVKINPSLLTKLRESYRQSERHEISLYDGGDLPTNRQVGIELERLQKAFPQLGKYYMVVLSERIIDRKMTAERLHDAINHVIDTCVYPVPGMAEVLGFDKKIKLYTYTQALRLKEEGIEFSKQFGQIVIDGKLKYYEQ